MIVPDIFRENANPVNQRQAHRRPHQIQQSKIAFWHRNVAANIRKK